MSSVQNREFLEELWLELWVMGKEREKPDALVAIFVLGQSEINDCRLPRVGTDSMHDLSKLNAGVI